MIQQKIHRFNLSPRLPQIDLQTFTMMNALRKGNNSTFEELLDTGSELTLISEDPKCHCGPCVKVGAYECQVISGVLAQVHITMGPLHPLNPSYGLFSQFQNP